MAGADGAAARAFTEALGEVVTDLQIALGQEAGEKIHAHYRLLMQWNERMNLTRVRDPRDVAVRHFGESLFLARELSAGVTSVLDVGSGAGFPGLPVAAWRQGLRVTLLEAAQRKAVFLREVCRSWGNVDVRNERLEGAAGHWDVSTMRAVAVEEALPQLARLSGSTALLLGEEGVDAAMRARCFEWEAPVALPWGERRYLLRGRLLGGV